jgi:hypothetical protein
MPLRLSQHFRQLIPTFEAVFSTPVSNIGPSVPLSWRQNDLLRNNMLDSCLGLRDGEEIQKKGIAVFHKFFGSNALFLWKSVVGDRGDGLHVPFLTGLGDEVVWPGTGSTTPGP